MDSYGYKSPAAEKSQIVKKTNKNQHFSPVSIQTGFSPFSRKLNLFPDFILTDKPKLLPKVSVSNETSGHSKDHIRRITKKTLLKTNQPEEGTLLRGAASRKLSSLNAILYTPRSEIK